MSFSVKAKEFVPSSSLSPLEPHSVQMGRVSPKETCKERVCMAYYECAECPYGDRCEHAHHFSELSPATQSKLLSSVPLEAIPAHFVLTPAVPAAVTSSPLWAMEGPSPFTGAAAPSQLSRQRLTPVEDHSAARRTRAVAAATPHSENHGKTGKAPGGWALDASVSSRTSSSNGAPIGPQLSSIAKASPAATFSPLALDAPFRMSLPPRCRYPHRGITGTYYDVLGLASDATNDAILGKYRNWHKEGFKRMRQVDPVGAEAVDRLIVEARNVLGNPALRAEYDRSLPHLPGRKSPVGVSTNTSLSQHRTQGHSSTTSTSSSTSEHPAGTVTRQLPPPPPSKEDVHGHNGTYSSHPSSPSLTLLSSALADAIW